MRAELKQILQQDVASLAQDMELNPKFWYMLMKVQPDIITSKQREAIEINKKGYDQVAALIGCLCQCPDEDYARFCQVLTDAQQEHVVNKHLKDGLEILGK